MSTRPGQPFQASPPQSGISPLSDTLWGPTPHKSLDIFSKFVSQNHFRLIFHEIQPLHFSDTHVPRTDRFQERFACLNETQPEMLKSIITFKYVQLSKMSLLILSLASFFHTRFHEQPRPSEFTKDHRPHILTPFVICKKLNLLYILFLAIYRISTTD